MPIVLNTNASATEATFNLSKANDNLRKSIARLSSGNRITKPTDDAGGLAVAYKLQSSVKRTEATLNNHQNALSFLAFASQSKFRQFGFTWPKDGNVDNHHYVCVYCYDKTLDRHYIFISDSVMGIPGPLITAIREHFPDFFIISVNVIDFKDRSLYNISKIRGV